MKKTLSLTLSLMFLCAIASLAATVADKKESQKALAKEAKITMNQARQTALQAVPGKIKEAELERENGKLIYSFDIKTRSGIKEVHIDAADGKVLSTDAESAAAEATEKAAEKKTRKP